MVYEEENAVSLVSQVTCLRLGVEDAYRVTCVASWTHSWLQCRSSTVYPKELDFLRSASINMVYFHPMRQLSCFSLVVIGYCLQKTLVAS